MVGAWPLCAGFYSTGNKREDHSPGVGLQHDQAYSYPCLGFLRLILILPSMFHFPFLLLTQGWMVQFSAQ